MASLSLAAQDTLPLSHFVLSALLKFGPASPLQLAVLLKAHPDSIRSVLRALEGDGLAVRVRVAKTLSLFAVTSRGAAALSQQLLVEPDRRLFGRMERWIRRAAHHEHATAWLLVALVRASSPPDHGLVDWKAPWFAARLFRQQSPKQQAASLVRHELVPDASGAYAFPGGVVWFFVETDMGTEELARVGEKAARYVRALRKRPRDAPWAVLVACPTPRRAASVSETIGSALEPGDEDVARFLVASRPELAERGPLAAVWEDAQTCDRMSLEELALWPPDREYSLEDGDFVGFPPRCRLPRDEAGRFVPRARVTA